MKHLSRFAAIPFGFVVIAFAIANRGLILVSLDPLPYIFEVPLYLVAVGGLTVGFAVGAIAAWFAGHSVRRQLRLSKARIAALESETLKSKTRKPSRSDLARLPADAA